MGLSASDLTNAGIFFSIIRGAENCPNPLVLLVIEAALLMISTRPAGTRSRALNGRRNDTDDRISIRTRNKYCDAISEAAGQRRRRIFSRSLKRESGVWALRAIAALNPNAKSEKTVRVFYETFKRLFKKLLTS